MNDDQMDEMLIQGARDYNAPREVPRDEMWKRIAEARAEARSGAVPAAGRRNAPVVRGVGIGIAAALILSIGVAIGRSFDRAATSAPVVAQGPTSVPSKPDGAKPVGSGKPEQSAATAVAAGPTTRDTITPKLREATRNTDRRVRELAAAPSPSGPSLGNRTSESLAYRLVVLQHLAGSEAMITSFRTGAKSGEVDAQLAGWARELLSTTRLLESSQASTDPVMKRLLGDLDLVISQIVQYTTHGVANPEELDLIERTIDKRGVITKLRSTNPGRGVAAGT